MQVEERKAADGGFKLDLEHLEALQERPTPFAEGESCFWDDPYISLQLLSAHLDPETDMASRRPSVIDREVAWLIIALRLSEESAVLDLGCGPGLYAARLAQHGLAVTGIDYARRSLDYASDYAESHDLDVTYVYQDYLTLDIEARFDAALLINGDYCVLPPDQRAKLLQNIHRALKPGGRFALDVVTHEHGERYGIANEWYVTEEGFWREGLHLVLQQGYHYPQEQVQLNQYIVVEPDGTTCVYRNWFQHFTPETMTQELVTQGFNVEYLGGDLRGSAYTETSPWIGVVAEKV